MKLSSITLAKDEEKNIRRCIEGLLPCVDEVIVILDNESADGTEEILKSFSSIKYFRSEWKGYAATKQHAVSLTTNDWILWVDADEALTPSLQQELLLFKHTEPPHSAYTVPRKAYFLGKWIKHSGWYPSRVTRLFNKQKGEFSSNEVHEHLIINGTSGELKSDLEHYTDPNLYHYFEKFNKYTSLAALELQKKGKRAGIGSLICRPPAIFLKMYIFRAGFLDGLEGFILAILSSAYVFTKYSKFLELKKKSKL